jgi:hypothetical protein
MARFTEGEITSMVRRYYLANGFKFLSTQSNGDKLYYCIDEIELNKKQPDSVVFKDDLLVVCEDKIVFSAIYSSKVNSKCDFNKIRSFLDSERNVQSFLEKIKPAVASKNIKIAGSLSSLAPKNSSVYSPILSEDLIILSIKPLDVRTYLIEGYIPTQFLKYFPKPITEISL